MQRTASFAVDGIWLGCSSALGSAATFPLPAGVLYPIAQMAGATRGEELVAAFSPADLAYAPPPGFAGGWCDAP